MPSKIVFILYLPFCQKGWPPLLYSLIFKNNQENQCQLIILDWLFFQGFLRIVASSCPARSILPISRIQQPSAWNDADDGTNHLRQKSLPYYDLPAGLMVPLVPLEDVGYKPIDPQKN